MVNLHILFLRKQSSKSVMQNISKRFLKNYTKLSRISLPVMLQTFLLKGHSKGTSREFGALKGHLDTGRVL